MYYLYVYLDPAYDGSSTIYSTDIVGLTEYRTQTADENEQNSFTLKFEVAAEDRIAALSDAISTILDDNKTVSFDEENIVEYLQAYKDEMNLSYYNNIVNDYKKAIELFREELENDYSNNVDSYSDITFTDENGTLYSNLLTTDVEAFLYAEGYISWNKKEARLTSSLVNNVTDLKSWTKEKAIETIFADKIPNDLEEVVNYWNTSVTLYTYIVNEETENYFQSGSVTLSFPNISGIQFANRLESVTVNGVTYGVPEYNEDGSVKEGSYEVLSIKINDVLNLTM
jgi:tetratricopeptide (TPR) repeat protein